VRIMDSVKVAIFYLMLALGSIIGVLFILTPAVPLIFFNRAYYFRYCSMAMGSYLTMASCLLEDFLGIKIIVTGDINLRKSQERSIIILNHRTRLDWMFIWPLYSRFQSLDKLKVVLKAELKHVPGPGWSMQHAGYVFLQRSMAKDEQTMRDMSLYYKECRLPFSLLIFPEGTNLTPETLLKSDKFAQDNNVKPYEYCLHPRTTGFKYLLNTMRKDGIIDNVDDITVAYEGEKYPVSELDFVQGLIPKAVHFHCKRYPSTSLPTDDKEIGEWLQKRWSEKEEQLQNFYKNKKKSV